MAKPVVKQLAERNIKLELSTEAKEILAREGFDPTFGARPLRRSIQRLIENPISEELLKGSIKPNTVIRVNVHNDQIVFEHTERESVGSITE